MLSMLHQISFNRVTVATLVASAGFLLSVQSSRAEQPSAITTQALAMAMSSVAMQTAPSTQPSALAHEKYTLPNGLTVILHQDKAIPKACVNLWYRVGARNEPPGRSGFAHLFEHLMFMGTNRVPGNQFDVLMETGGGQNNASTSLDRTNYFSSGPSNLLPTLLWLDADRLEDMAITMTQEKLDTQRGVVRNERRQVVENAPYMKAYEASLQLLYPSTHPYYNGVIGTHKDLEAGTVQDVKDFFGSFYAPANCTLVVAGDFEVDPTKALIAQLFGDLPKGNIAPQVNVPAPMLTRVIRSTSFDRVQLPALLISYHSPGELQAGDAEMHLLGGLLADGQASRLYQRLVVEEKLAAEVSASQDNSAMSSVFRIMVLALPDADIAKIETIVDEEIARVRTTGATPDELERLKNQKQLAIVSGLQSIESRADKLNSYEYFWGEPDGLQRELDLYRNATFQSIKAMANAVLRPEARLVQVVLPEEPERAQAGRDTRPADSAATAFSPPAPITFKLDNGMNAMLLTKPGIPLVEATLIASHAPGSPLDAVNQAGRTALMASMLSEGTGNLDGKSFAQALEGLGADMSAGASIETFSLDVSSLASNADKAFALVGRALAKPSMEAEAFDRVKNLRVEALKQALDEPRSVANNLAMRQLMGENHPYSVPSGGTVATVEALTLSDIKTAHSQLLASLRAGTIILAGDITEQRAKDLLNRTFGDIVKSGTAPAPFPAIVQPASFAKDVATTEGLPRVYVVDREDAPQTMVLLMAPGENFASQSRVQQQLLNVILGGSFTSRLNQNLREKHSYTYGARSTFNHRRVLGTFSASAAVQTQYTGAALKEMFFELSRIASGDISADEVSKAAQIYATDVVGDFGTLGGMTSRAASVASMGVPWETIANDVTTSKQADAKKLTEVATASIALDHAVLVLVGQKNEILKQLADPSIALKLGTPVLVDAEGNPVK